MEEDGKKAENAIEKLQSLPEGKKKVIFFIVMGFIVLIMIFFAVLLTKRNIGMVSRSLGSLSFPKIDTRGSDKSVIPGFNLNRVTSSGLEGVLKEFNMDDTSTGDGAILQNPDYSNTSENDNGFFNSNQ